MLTLSVTGKLYAEAPFWDECCLGALALALNPRGCVDDIDTAFRMQCAEDAGSISSAVLKRFCQESKLPGPFAISLNSCLESWVSCLCAA